MKPNTLSWKRIVFGTIIDEPYKAYAHAKIELDTSNDWKFGYIPFVTRTENNNGVDCYVPREELQEIEQGNAIVIGDTTATISYQKNEFGAGDHIVVIRSNWLNEYTGQFIVTLLQRERFRYSYGRAFLVKAIKSTELLLPVTESGEPDWGYMEEYIKTLHHKPLTTCVTKTSNIELDTEGWKKFKLMELFDIKKGKRLTSEEQTEGMTPYIGAIDSNNGIANYIGQEAIHRGNTISLSYNGSVGEAFYQPVDFWATDDVNVLYFKSSNGVVFNKYLALFICAILRKEKYRYCYGRKWVLESMNETVIKLPAKNDVPDWGYMEKYMKSLPYSDRI